MISPGVLFCADMTFPARRSCYAVFAAVFGGCMDRRAVSRGIRRLSPFMVLVVVLGLLAGVIPLLASQPSGGSGGGLAVQAPGSSGSVHSVPWWDPRGWFGGGGGGSGSTSARVLA